MLRNATLAVCLLLSLSPVSAQIVDIASSPSDPFALGAQANETNEHYGAAAFSDDGRYIVFDSRASNLVAGDDNHNYDTFVKDRVGGAITIVSHRPDGHPGNNESYEGTISGDGRFVAFYSYANDLVAGDTNNSVDVFVTDRLSGAVERVSIGTDGVQGNGYSYSASLSRDGRYVTFLSSASNLVAGDTNGVDDVFLRDRALGLTLRLSVGAGGVQANSDAIAARIDAQGRLVCFVSSATNLVPDDANGSNDVFVRDVLQSTTALISRTPGGQPGNGSAEDCAIAADSGAVAFTSDASNLTATDPNGASRDVFVYEPSAGAIARIDAGESNYFGAAQPDISADGRYVVFASDASTLPGPHAPYQPEIYFHDRTMSTTTRVSLSTTGQAPARYSDAPRVAPDGTVVLYNAFSDDQVADDTNRQRDALLYTVAVATRQRAAAPPTALPSGGGGTQSSLSADGRYIAFASAAGILAPSYGNGFMQVYVYDSALGTTSLISHDATGGVGNAASLDPHLSADGRYVAFVSQAANLVADPDANGTYDVFLHDRMLGTTVRITSDAMGNAANDRSDFLTMSADGRRLAFITQASNLLPGATTAERRLLVFDRIDGFSRADISPTGTLPNAAVFERASFSADGRYIAFASQANSFVPADDNPYTDVFRKDLDGGALVLVSRRSDGGFANQQCNDAAISGDGRFLAYRSIATNLVDGDDNGSADIFRTEVATGTTIRVTDTLRGPSSAFQRRPRLNADGRQVAFESSAALLPADTNNAFDVYVYDAQFRRLTRASVGPTGAQYGADSMAVAISADGQWLSFDVSPSVVPIAGRYNAPAGADVFKARNPAAELLFFDDFE
jgi:Tol biopolymer transport system component